MSDQLLVSIDAACKEIIAAANPILASAQLILSKKYTFVQPGSQNHEYFQYVSLAPSASCVKYVNSIISNMFARMLPDLGANNPDLARFPDLKSGFQIWQYPCVWHSRCQIAKKNPNMPKIFRHQISWSTEIYSPILKVTDCLKKIPENFNFFFK